MKQFRQLSRTPYYVLTGGLAIIFLFPLVWSAFASVSPQGGTAQSEGFGFGNYVKLMNYDAGLPTYILNSVIVSGLTVILVAFISLLAGYAFARFSSPARTCSS